MTRDEERKLNRTLDECFEYHVPMTRNDRRRLRDIVIDAIEQAGFFIGSNVQANGQNVGNANNSPSSSYVGPISNVPYPTDYGFDEDDEDLQALMDRDRE